MSVRLPSHLDYVNWVIKRHLKYLADHAKRGALRFAFESATWVQRVLNNYEQHGAGLSVCHLEQAKI